MLSVAIFMVMANQKALTIDWFLDPGPFRPVATSPDPDGDVFYSNGLITRRFHNGTTVAFDNLMTGAAMVRAARPEVTLTIDGKHLEVGGLTGQPDLAYLTEEWINSLKPSGDFMYRGWRSSSAMPGMKWEKRGRHSEERTWPPTGATFRIMWVGSSDAAKGMQVDVYYHFYEGMPLVAKRFVLTNLTGKSIRVDKFRVENLAMVEGDSTVERSSDWNMPPIHVETNMAFGGDSAGNANRAVKWLPDPDYTTQVNYRLETPCILACEPPLGPAQDLKDGEAFESFTVYELAFDSTDRERNSMAVRRMYRSIAPWTTENPLMLHVTSTDPEVVRTAIDQCADVGFEMVILSFGSGLNMEDTSPENIAKFRALADYAHSKNVQLGGYSLLASRSISPEVDVINPKTGKPGDAIFGSSPCLCSEWGRGYFERIKTFLVQTGFDLLEHDGSYPGDPCASTTHADHTGLEDSQWKQWKRINEFYAWCRSQGIFLNVPDWYVLQGSNKTAMGYRETNWSLPRALQVVHGRQNLFDGTWRKTPTMGWMFVPLVQYHGGGAAATIEPLKDHLDVYEQHLANNLGFGAQACYRGPRLYDSPETRSLVKKYVDWFKKYRGILESDIIHLRRADGRDIDYVLHVNAKLKTKAMLVVYSPLNQPVERTISVPLSWVGDMNQVNASINGESPKLIDVDKRGVAKVQLKVPANGFVWVAFE